MKFSPVVKFTVLVAAAFGLFQLYQISSNVPVEKGAGSQVSDVAPAAGDDGVIGGSFSLTDHNGKAVTQDDYGTGYKLVFFGFTHCPDVCPAGLQKIAKTYEILGDRAQELTTLFITVDPARDTPEVMKEYVALYHPDFTGLTGTQEQIDATIESFKVYAAKVSLAEPEETAGHDHGDAHGDHHDMAAHDDHYMMNHSAYIYLLDSENNAIEFFGSTDSAAAMAETLEKLL